MRKISVEHCGQTIRLLLKLDLMSLGRLLENWETYDNRKKKGEDSRYFSCTEDWEVDYLIQKISEMYPFLSREVIKGAIQSCCQVVRAPRPRRIFVQCVVQRLGLL
jgi:hypothetical protein